jgi:hypothetical protein
MSEPFDRWLRRFPWLNERGLACVASADLDGLACALLQHWALGWEFVGTYDGQTLCLFRMPERIDWERLAFIDVEILHPRARSIGNHMLALDSDDNTLLIRSFPNLANPNLWRGMTVSDGFQRKYPFGSLPLLVAARAVFAESLDLNRAWFGLMLHADSAFTNAATYQANALDWLRSMGETDSPGLARLCRLLSAISTVQALALLDDVQRWAADAGFGPRQRACRFRPEQTGERERAARLLTRLCGETSVSMPNPLASEPVCIECFCTHQYSLKTSPRNRQRDSFREVRRLPVLSLAATSRNEKGLSATLANAGSVVPQFRDPPVLLPAP